MQRLVSPCRYHRLRRRRPEHIAVPAREGTGDIVVMDKNPGRASGCSGRRNVSVFWRGYPDGLAGFRDGGAFRGRLSAHARNSPFQMNGGILTESDSVFPGTHQVEDGHRRHGHSRQGSIGEHDPPRP